MLPYGGVFMIYVVKSGDTLQKISDETRIPVQKIIADNQLIYSERLVPGQALLLLGEGEEGDLAQGLLTAGYAYPFIDPPVLEEALPSLGRCWSFPMALHLRGIWSRPGRMTAGWRSGRQR